jgi:hypothetical protein
MSITRFINLYLATGYNIHAENSTLLRGVAVLTRQRCTSEPVHRHSLSAVIKAVSSRPSVHQPGVPLDPDGVFGVLHLEAGGEAGLIPPAAALHRVEAPGPAGHSSQQEQDP